MSITTIPSVDPANGRTVDVDLSTVDVGEACRAALAAAKAYEAGGRPLRLRVLMAVADALEAHRTEIVSLGQRETGLPSSRLEGELTRTTYQARMFAAVVEEGSFLEATIDHAGQTPMGPGPDLRRMLVPIGPVAVFGASNFPLAFSAPGGDTVSALAAGCPVVIKGHDSHPALSLLVFETMREAALSAGAPDGLLGLVFGLQAGIDLVSHPAIRAVGFTGSLGGGKALMAAINRRPDPIPFFGELASLNPVVVTASAARFRGERLADELIASVTGSAGQLCTKPGLVLIPAGDDGEAMVDAASRALMGTAPAVVLNERVRDAYNEIGRAFVQTRGMRVIAEGAHSSEPGFRVAARLLEIDAQDLLDFEMEECFGPTTVVVRYRPGEERDVIERLPGSLTATIHAEDHERALVAELTELFRPKAGRLLYAGYPTGVLVSWAQHHGGPWPATNSQHTSVGATAVRRFQRPVSWQSAPDWLLPQELRDDERSIPRRINGRLVLPDQTS